MYELIPDELKALKNWVCWRAEPDPKSHSGIKKVPINPRTGYGAKSNDASTWSDFNTATAAAVDYAGIGFMFKDSGYFGIDIDDRPDELAAFKAGDRSNTFGIFIDRMQSYAEISQSGNGVHIICKGQLPGKDFKNGELGVEMYAGARFFIMTGNLCTDYVDITDGTDSVIALYEQYKTGSDAPQQMPLTAAPVDLDTAQIIERAQRSSNGQKFAALYAGDYSAYGSQSEADMAFCNMLAFWCGGDLDKMDAIYRSSGLMREKWDRKQSGSTYGRLTLQKAAAECTSTYSGRSQQQYAVSIKAQADSAQPRTAGRRYKFDDSGNAERLNDAFGDILHYSYVEKKWLFYNEGKWYYDNVGYHRTIADAAVALMEQERPLYTETEELEKAFDKHLKKSRSYSGKTNMLNEAQHCHPILPSMLDQDKTIFGVKNGIVNLKSGELMPHDKSAYLTKQSTISYNPDAPEPTLWLRFLRDIFGGDEYMLRYIQKCVGYSLTGSTNEQCAFFLYGTGRNGKSTFLEIVRGICGDYATNIQPQTIMISNKSGNAPTGDIARLKGARFVTSVEPNEGMRIDEGLLKQLTGDDVVTARKMFAEEFEFKPEFKLWMATNHKPIIRGTDTGIWRRIHLIPFEVQIPEDKVDKHLKYKLVKEAESILKWAVDGCLLWQREGLTMPKQVLDALAEYRREMDVLSAFLEDCTVAADGSEVRSSQLYSAYARWADENNEYKMSSTKFGAEMAKKLERYKGRDGCMYYKRIRLLVGTEFPAEV